VVILCLDSKIGWQTWRFRARSFHRGKKSLRGGVFEHVGKFGDGVINIAYVIVNHVLCPVSTAGNRNAIGSFEKPAMLKVSLDTEPALMHQSMVA